MSPPPTFTRPGDELPALAAPFAVFLCADDPAWSDSAELTRQATRLLAAGCRYFVCFGPASEAVHDAIDWVIVAGGHEDITTTWHADESAEDAAEFFRTIAIADMNAALVLAEDTTRWTRIFAAAA